MHQLRNIFKIFSNFELRRVFFKLYTRTWFWTQNAWCTKKIKIPFKICMQFFKGRNMNDNAMQYYNTRVYGLLTLFLNLLVLQLVHSNLHITNLDIVNFAIYWTKPSSHFGDLLSILHIWYCELFDIVKKKSLIDLFIISRFECIKICMSNVLE